MFTTADSYFRFSGRHTAPEHLVRASWPHHRARFQMPEGTVGTVPAEVNHGRWIVKCPAPRCEGAQLASEGDPRFFCVDCLFEELPSSGWLRVVWPKDRQGIEAALAPRRPPFRNWLPHETVEDLLRENERALTIARAHRLLDAGTRLIKGDLRTMDDDDVGRLLEAEPPLLGDA